MCACVCVCACLCECVYGGGLGLADQHISAKPLLVLHWRAAWFSSPVPRLTISPFTLGTAERCRTAGYCNPPPNVKRRGPAAELAQQNLVSRFIATTPASAVVCVSVHYSSFSRDHHWLPTPHLTCPTMIIVLSLLALHPASIPYVLFS